MQPLVFTAIITAFIIGKITEGAGILPLVYGIVFYINTTVEIIGDYMNVLQNLTELYNHLSIDSTYRKVCKGILENLDAAADGTLYDIAELTNSSRTTVWRMVKKMGYNDFTEFHHELKKAVKQYSYYNRIIPPASCTSGEEIKNALLAQTSYAFELLQNQLLPEDVENDAKALKNADKIRFYVPYQDCAISSLQQNLSIDGKDTGCFCLLPDMLEDSKSLSENSIVYLGAIEHAETMDLSPLLKQIKKINAKILMVTSGDKRYEKYISRKIFSHDNKGKIVADILAFDIYFIMLSEIYRKNYID